MRKKERIPRKGAEGVLVGLIVRALAGLFYVAGLTVVIPLALFLISPPPDIVAMAYLTAYFTAAVVVVLVSVIIIFWWKKSFGKTLKTLGVMTLIPGIIALLFTMYGKEVVLNWFSSRVPNFIHVEPILMRYVDIAVPKLGWLTFVYIVLGVGLFVWGMRHQEKVFKRNL